MKNHLKHILIFIVLICISFVFGCTDDECKDVILVDYALYHTPQPLWYTNPYGAIVWTSRITYNKEPYELSFRVENVSYDYKTVQVIFDVYISDEYDKTITLNPRTIPPRSQYNIECKTEYMYSKYVGILKIKNIKLKEVKSSTSTQSQRNT